MACPNEWTWTLYVDGELAEPERLELTRHLDEICPNCRELVDALQQENRLLVQAFAEIQSLNEEFEIAARRGKPVDVARLAAYVAGLAMTLRLGFEFLAGLRFPAGLDWLNPFGLMAQLNLVVTGLVYVVNEGGVMMGSIINNGGLVALCVLGLFGLIASWRQSARTTAMFGITALILGFPASSYALDIRSGELVTVSGGEMLDDTLLATGDSVRIDGAVTGDVIAFARQVEVRGIVEGNVFACAQRVEVSGEVGGSIVGAAQTIRVSGQAMRNLYGFAQLIVVESTGGVVGNATMFGADGSVDGPVGRDVTMFGGRLSIASDIGQNVLFRGGRVSLGAPAIVRGNLTARVEAEDDVQIGPGATVIGQTGIELSEPERNRYATVSFYLGQAIGIAAAFVTGLLLFWLFPGLARVNLASARALVTASGIGFVTVIAVPVAALILAITLIGLPIALTGIGLWLVGLYLAKIVIAQFVGKSLLRGQGDRVLTIAPQLLTGLVLIFIAVNLPYIGRFLHVLLILVGLGSLVLTSYRTGKWWYTTPDGSEPGG